MTLQKRDFLAEKQGEIKTLHSLKYAAVSYDLSHAPAGFPLRRQVDEGFFAERACPAPMRTASAMVSNLYRNVYLISRSFPIGKQPSAWKEKRDREEREGRPAS